MFTIWCLLYLFRLLILADAQLPPREEICNPDFFGRPENQDCKDALTRLPDWGMTVSDDEGWEPVREFIRTGGSARISSPNNQDNIVQTPLLYTNGTCTVAVVIPNDIHFTDSMLVETRKLNGKADLLRSKCVENQGSGGLFHGVIQWRGYDIEDFPNIYIFGAESDAERYLDYMYDCITDADGNELCRNVEQVEESAGAEAEKDEPDWMQFITDVVLPEQERPASKGSNRACKGSCLDLEDCDIGSDCLCASTKGILLSSTWGKHSCMHVAGTAIALAAAAIKPSGICRGRCLLEANGTVEIAQTANQTSAAASIDVPLANFTELSNATGSLNPVSKHSKSVLSNNRHEPSSGVPLVTSSSQTSPGLICPCNCTYVSASCCLSPIVWEEPSMRIHMDPPPANASVACDIGSGKWVPKPTASSSSIEDNNGFIGLGSVKWNSSAAGTVKIPQR